MSAAEVEFVGSAAWIAATMELLVVESNVRSSKLSSLNAAARFRALVAEAWRTRARISTLFDVDRFIEVPF